VLTRLARNENHIVEEPDRIVVGGEILKEELCIDVIKHGWLSIAVIGIVRRNRAGALILS